MSVGVSGGGKGGADVPSFGNVDLTPGMMATGNAIANRYAQLGLGDSSMVTQDEAANTMRWDVEQAQLNNQLAQQQFEDQIQANNQDSGGFSLGLGSLAGLF